MTRALIIADTHIPSFRRELPEALAPYLERCDVILHAGDVCAPSVLDELRTHAPVIAVMGNMDGPDLAATGVPQQIETEIGGVAIAMLHDGGRAQGRGERLRRRFPDAGLIVFGHSHIPLIERIERTTIVNPGSATWKRGQPFPTIALAVLAPDEVRAELIELPNA